MRPRDDESSSATTSTTAFTTDIANLAPAAFADAQGKVGARDGRGDALPSRDADRAEPGVRDGGGRGALRRPATIRQSNLAEGGEPRDVEFEVYRDADSGLALRRANVDEKSWIHFTCRADAGVAHRLDHHYLQRGPEHFDGPVPLYGCEPHSRHPNSGYEQQPSKQARSTDAGVPRLPGTEPRVRRRRRRQGRRRALR